MAHYTNSGLWIAERAHSPREEGEVECVDCFENISDPDSEYCEYCGEPCCEECQNWANDEALCVKCLVSFAEVALANLRRDPLVGDIFQDAA
jgi:hypothetical protein